MQQLEQSHLEKALEKDQMKIQQVSEIIKQIIDIIGMDTDDDINAAKALDQYQKDLETEEFELPAIGDTKAGKSTLLTAIMGPSDQEAWKDKIPLPIDSKEATALPVVVRYGKKATVYKLLEKDTIEEMSLSDFLEMKVSQDEKLNNEKFLGLKGFIVEYPNNLLKNGLCLKDLPGLDGNQDRTEITNQQVKRNFVGLMVFSNRFSENTKAYSKYEELIQAKCKIFVVLNDRYESGSDKERFKTAKILYEVFLKKPFLDDADNDYEQKATKCYAELEQYDIYLIDAQKAWIGKLNGNKTILEASGIEKLEVAIARFFSQDLSKKKFDHLLSASSQVVTERIEDIAKKIQSSEDKIETHKKEVKIHEQELKSIAARHTVALNTINEYKQKTEQEVVRSFDSMIDELLSRLLIKIDSVKGSIFDILTVKSELEKMIQEELKLWEMTQSEPILNKNAQELFLKLIRLTSNSKNKIDQVNINQSVELKSDIGVWERVFSAAGGFFVGGVITGVAGATMGRRGAAVAGGFGLAAAIGAALLGLGPLGVVIAIIAAELFGFGVSIDEVKKDLTVNKIEGVKEQLQKAKENGSKEISNKIAKAYQKLISETNAEFVAIEKETSKELTNANNSLKQILGSESPLIQKNETKKQHLIESLEKLKLVASN